MKLRCTLNHKDKPRTQRCLLHSAESYIFRECIFFLLFIIFISIWYLWKTCFSHWYSDFWFWSIVRRFFSPLSLKLFLVVNFIILFVQIDIFLFVCLNSIRLYNILFPVLRWNFSRIWFWVYKFNSIFCFDASRMPCRSPDSHRAPWRRRNTFTWGTTSQSKIDCCVDVAADDDEVRI